MTDHRTLHLSRHAAIATSAGFRLRGNDKAKRRPGPPFRSYSEALRHRLRRLGFLGFQEFEADLVVLVDVDGHLPARDQPAEEKLLGERLPDGVLDEARHGSRTHLRIEALARQELLQLRREARLDLLLLE